MIRLNADFSNVLSSDADKTVYPDFLLIKSKLRISLVGEKIVKK